MRFHLRVSSEVMHARVGHGAKILHALTMHAHDLPDMAAAQHLHDLLSKPLPVISYHAQMSITDDVPLVISGAKMP